MALRSCLCTRSLLIVVYLGLLSNLAASEPISLEFPSEAQTGWVRIQDPRIPLFGTSEAILTDKLEKRVLHTSSSKFSQGSSGSLVNIATNGPSLYESIAYVNNDHYSFDLSRRSERDPWVITGLSRARRPFDRTDSHNPV